MVKTDQEINAMRKGGNILGKILKAVGGEVEPGVTTEELNILAERMIADSGSEPAFKGYTVPGLPPFPCTLCTSINDEVVHGVSVPARELREGDIIGIDCGIIYTHDGVRVFLDAAITVPVGNVSQEVQSLINVTRQSLEKGIDTIKSGITTGDLGYAIQEYSEKHGYSVIRELVGHGVGRDVHEPPQIPNYGKKGRGDKLVTGMTIAVEPMLSLGSWELLFYPNSWKVTTKDHSMSAHFEHTVLVTEDGCEVLTLPGE